MTRTLTRNQKLWITFFAVVAFLTRVVLIFRPRWEFSPVGDDAFYVFSIARNIARGLGPTVDGRHLTNGFQPLIAVLYAPIFWLCGASGPQSTDASWRAVDWTFVLAGIIAAASVWVLTRLICELESPVANNTVRESWATPPVIGAFLWTFSTAIFMHTTNGLETGLYSLMLLWSMLVYARIRRPEHVRILDWGVLGILLGLTVLARIDAAILVAILAGYEFLRRRSIGPILMAGIALLLSSPWWLYNWIQFGSLMPTSGQAENLWPVGFDENIRRALQGVTDIALLVMYAPDAMGIATRALLAVVIGASFWILIRKTNILSALQRTRIRVLLPFAVFSLVLLIYYTCFFKAPHFIARFLEPMRIGWLIVTALSVPALLETLPKSRRKMMLAALAVLTLGFGADRYVTNFFLVPSPSEFFETGEWALEHPTEKIGMLQSGIAGFIAPNIINLDGKVNTDALRAVQNGRLPEYLRAEHFTFLADWQPFVEDIARDCARNELFFDSVGRVGRTSKHPVQLMKLRDSQ